MAFLSCNNISYYRGIKSIIKNISCSLEQGEIIYLKGANGSGKTTFLKIIAQILTEYDGDIIWKSDKPNNQEITYISHLNGLHDSLSVEENILYWGKLADYKFSQNKLNNILDGWDLRSLRFALAGKLSQGQQRRLALARLSLRPSKLWLLDEPDVNLDEKYRQLLDGKQQSFLKLGGAIIKTSHQKDIAHNKKIIQL
jgi:heme exporter protein A